MYLNYDLYSYNFLPYFQVERHVKEPLSNSSNTINNSGMQ